MKEPWHKKILREYKQEVIKAAIIALVSSCVFGLIYYFLGRGYELRQVHLPEPTLTLRLLSGLVFSSLGRILYKLKFYYVLKIILVYILRLKELYDFLKGIIWYFLMFIMGYYIVPWVMNVINFILTILLNAGMFLVYISPHVGVFIVAFLLTFYFLKKKSAKNPA